MNGTQIWASIKRGFAGLFRFGGRDTRGQFWPFALIVLGIEFLGSMVVTAQAALGAMGGAFESIRAAEGGQVDQAAMQGQMMQSMMGNMQHTVIISAIIGAVGTLALLAATARRLHDRNWSGWWLAGAIIAQIAGAYFAQKQLAAINQITDWSNAAAMAEISVNAGMGGTIVSLATWGFYIIMLVQLVQEGTPGANRFGAGAAPPNWPE
jgi:uncharacterized membrane protein YhaH (DUF805 family)